MAYFRTWIQTFFHQRLDYLDTQERIVARSPTNPKVSPRLEKWFYPSTKGRSFAPADKVVIPLIFISIFIMILEYGAHEDAKPYLEYMLIATTVLFIIEYLIRFYVKKRPYINSAWGIIDFTCIVADLVSYFLPIIITGGMNIGAIIRPFRLLRLLRLLRAIQYWPLIRTMFIHSKPFIRASVKTISIIAFACGIPLLTLWSVNPDSIIIDMFKMVFNIPDKSNNEDTDIINHISTFVLGVTALMLLNIFAAIFSPMADRIIKSQKDQIKKDLKYQHIVVYTESEQTITEEILYVMSDYTTSYSVFMSPDNSVFSGTDIPPNMETVVGGLDSTADCARVNASDASLILLVGIQDFDARSFYQRIYDPHLREHTYPTIFWLREGDVEQPLETVFTRDTFRVLSLHLGSLRAAVVNSLWNQESVQFEAYKLLIDFYDKNWEIPSPLPKNEVQPEKVVLAESTIKKAIEDNAIPDVIIDTDPNRGAIRLYIDNDDESLETLVLHALDHASDIHSEKMQGVNIFYMVRDFHLTKRNLYYSGACQGFRIIIIASEFAMALSLLHERECTGILKLWLGDKKKLSEAGDLSHIEGQFLTQSQMKKLDDKFDGVLDKNGCFVGFAGQYHRIRVASDFQAFSLPPTAEQSPAIKPHSGNDRGDQSSSSSL